MTNPCYCIMIQLTITLPQKWVYVEPPWLITALDYSGLFSSLLAAVPNKPDHFWFSNASVSVRARMSGFSEGWPWRNLLMPQHPSWLSAGHRHRHGRKRGCGTKPLRFPAGNFIYLFIFVRVCGWKAFRIWTSQMILASFDKFDSSYLLFPCLCRTWRWHAVVLLSG